MCSFDKDEKPTFNQIKLKLATQTHCTVKGSIKMINFWKNSFTSPSQDVAESTKGQPVQIQNCDELLLESIDSSSGQEEDAKKYKLVGKTTITQSQNKNYSQLQNIDCEDEQLNTQDNLQPEQLMKQICIRETIDFNDDLTNSIRQSGSYDNSAYSGKQQQTPTNRKQKHRPSQLPNQSQSELQQREVGFSGSFSDISSQEQVSSFSGLNQQSNLRVERDFSKIKSKKIKQMCNDDINLWGTPEQVVPSTINIQEYKRNSRINHQVKTINQNKQTKHQQDDECIYLQKSMYTQRQTMQVQKRTFNTKKSPTKDKQHQALWQKDERRESEVDVQEMSVKRLNESHYMTNVVEDKGKKGGKDRGAKQEQKREQSQNAFTIELRDSLYFIKYQKNPQKLITQKLFQNLTQHFLIINIMLPIFNSKHLERCKEQSGSQGNRQYFRNYVQVYTRFLSNKYPSQTRKFFQDQRQGKHSLLESQIGVKKQQPSAFGNIFKKLSQYFQKNHYSKAQFLKCSLEAQLQFIQQYIQSWTQQNYPFTQAQQVVPQRLQKKTSSASTTASIPSSIKIKCRQLNKEITKLEMLISFEKSEMYCDNKLEDKLEQNIWKQRKRKLIEDRNWFIVNLFDQCYV